MQSFKHESLYGVHLDGRVGPAVNLVSGQSFDIIRIPTYIRVNLEEGSHVTLHSIPSYHCAQRIPQLQSFMGKMSSKRF